MKTSLLVLAFGLAVVSLGQTASASAASEDAGVVQAIQAARSFVRQHAGHIPQVPASVLKDCEDANHERMCEDDEWFDGLPVKTKALIETFDIGQDLIGEEQGMIDAYRALLKKYASNKTKVAAIRKFERGVITQRNHFCLTATDEQLRADGGRIDDVGHDVLVWACIEEKDNENTFDLKGNSPDAPWMNGFTLPVAKPLNLSQPTLAVLAKSLSVDPQDSSRVIGVMMCSLNPNLQKWPEGCNSLAANLWPGGENYITLDTLLSSEGTHFASKAEATSIMDPSASYWKMLYVSCKSVAGQVSCQTNPSKVNSFGDFQTWVK